MGALPKQRISRAKQGFRRQHDTLTAAPISACPQCRAYRLSHHVCPSCGYYAGRQVLQIEAKARREE